MRPCAAMHGTSLLLLMTGIACGHSEDSGRAVPGGVGTAGDTEGPGPETAGGAGRSAATAGQGFDATGGTVPASGGSTASAGTAGGVLGGSSASGPSDAGADDAPYANVTQVSVSGSAGAYTFTVSVESADIDCSQFANWWEVLAEDGSLLFRRILQHSHTDENGTTDPDAPGNTFTRSGGPVDIAEDDVVIVRAHMSTGGYNGVAMIGSAADGFAAAPQIGSDFAAEVETLDPQPTDCMF